MKLKNTLSKAITFTLLLSLINCENKYSTNQIEEIKTMNKKIINPWTWQDKFGFVQANEVTNVNRTLYTAGIVSVDDDGNLLYPNNMEKQIEQIFHNMEVLIKQANYELSNVVRFTYYTTDIESFTNAAQVLANCLQKSGCKPATSLIGVNALFHPDCVIEIEATVVD